MTFIVPVHGLRKPRSFDAHLTALGLPLIRRGATTTLQVNVGRRCNQACTHCHVEAGPKRTEMMSDLIVDRVITLMNESKTLHTLDITGGAPELHPRFRDLVRTARAAGKRVIDRCNLTILMEPGMEDLAAFLAEHDVDVVASLPCYTLDNVDKQRGRGVFEASIAGLRALNALGYGTSVGTRSLDLVYNPGGAFLPPAQAGLEARYRDELRANFGVEFTRLLTITNMVIKRFEHSLTRDGLLQTYESLLEDNFNAETLPSLMCRSLVSIAWDGQVHDCDFNQMLDMPAGGLEAMGARDVFGLESLDAFEDRAIATAQHCFGCTAGAGSSCSGALSA